MTGGWRRASLCETEDVTGERCQRVQCDATVTRTPSVRKSSLNISKFDANKGDNSGTMEASDSSKLFQETNRIGYTKAACFLG